MSDPYPYGQQPDGQPGFPPPNKTSPGVVVGVVVATTVVLLAVGLGVVAFRSGRGGQSSSGQYRASSAPVSGITYELSGTLAPMNLGISGLTVIYSGEYGSRVTANVPSLPWSVFVSRPPGAVGILVLDLTGAAKLAIMIKRGDKVIKECRDAPACQVSS